VDHYWKKLGTGGPKEMQNCGWLQDKFGVIWQVVPERFMKMVTDKDCPQSGPRDDRHDADEEAGHCQVGESLQWVVQAWRSSHQ
jgi:hypothetical protein